MQDRASLFSTSANGFGASYRTVTRRWPVRMKVTAVVLGMSVSEWHISVAVM